MAKSYHSEKGVILSINIESNALFKVDLIKSSTNETPFVRNVPFSKGILK